MTIAAQHQVLALGFLGSGASTSSSPRLYEPIMPAWVPTHREVILGSGVAEIALGAGLLAPATRRAGRLGERRAAARGVPGQRQDGDRLARHRQHRAQGRCLRPAARSVADDQGGAGRDQKRLSRALRPSGLRRRRRGPLAVAARSSAPSRAFWPTVGVEEQGVVGLPGDRAEVGTARRTSPAAGPRRCARAAWPGPMPSVSLWLGHDALAVGRELAARPRGTRPTAARAARSGSMTCEHPPS